MQELGIYLPNCIYVLVFLIFILDTIIQYIKVYQNLWKLLLKEGNLHRYMCAAKKKKVPFLKRMIVLKMLNLYKWLYNRFSRVYVETTRMTTFIKLSTGYHIISKMLLQEERDCKSPTLLDRGLGNATCQEAIICP